MEVRVPQQLHLPLQILWFYQDEVMVIIASYVIAMIAGGWFWLTLIVAPFAYIKLKRNKPRGFLVHTLYKQGLIRFDGYPTIFYREYRE